jgi:ribosomal protein S2
MINKALKLKQNQKEFLLNSLIKSKNFYGESTNKIKKNNLPFIYGVRHNFFIINLKHTISFLKKSLNLIQITLRKKKNILVIGDAFDINFLLNQQFIKKNKNIFFFFKKKKIDLIVFLKSETKEKYLLTEIKHTQIPVIALSNTNTDTTSINYPIISNNKNLKSIFFLMYLIRKII